MCSMYIPAGNDMRKRSIGIYYSYVHVDFRLLVGRYYISVNLRGKRQNSTMHCTEASSSIIRQYYASYIPI